MKNYLKKINDHEIRKNIKILFLIKINIISESKRTAKKFAKNIPDKTRGTDERKYKIIDLLDEW